MSGETEPTAVKAAPAAVETEGDKTGTERLIFFSDAVVAIAITLLALELPIPSGDSPSAAWRSFGGHRDEYAAFLISFAVIANLWSGHHRLFRHVTRVHYRIIRINLLWLLAVVVTPFATRVLVGDVSFPMAFTLYAIVQAISALMFLTMTVMIRQDHLSAADVPATVLNGTIWRSTALAVAFAVSIPVAYATHWAYAVWAVVPVLFGAIRRGRAGTDGQSQSRPAART